MKTDMRIIVGLMIAVILAGGLFLWLQGRSTEEILGTLDPESFDVETTCIEKNGQYLVCNEGHDTFFVYDDVEVYVKNIDTVVKENGDAETITSYQVSSLSKLEKSIEKNDSVLLHLWLTEQGQIETIMMVELSLENYNASLVNLEGLDPATYQASNIMLAVDEDSIKLAPVNYDEDEKDKFDGLVNIHPLAKDAKFHLGKVTLKTDADGRQITNTQYERLSYSDLRDMEEGLTVHVWMNDDGQVTHVLVHQETAAE